MVETPIWTDKRANTAQALIDSGSASNFISHNLLQRLNVKRKRCPQNLEIHTILGKPLGRGRICQFSPTMTLRIGCLHSEEISFLLLEGSTADIILGRPWMLQHEPQIDWKTETSSVALNSTTIESPDSDKKMEIPPEYRAFQDVFSKRLATQLPPHRPWECAIDLLPEATLPKGRVYPPSIPEQKAMEEYIKEALRQNFIRPSTYTTCIFSKLDLRSAYNLIRIRKGDEWKTAFVTPSGHYEYRVMPYGLSNAPSVFQGYMNEIFRDFLHRFVIFYIDDILIFSKNLTEHHQHMKQVLQRLREQHLYLKLEKCEFHTSTVHFLGYINQQGIQMDQRKVEAIRNWPQPVTIKELQRFIGFAKFYRRLIHNYSLLSSPLTSLLKTRPKSLSWNPEATTAFATLKEAFANSPILIHPDPELPFTIEVDASSTGVGAVLSQRQGNPPLLHLLYVPSTS
ncbi:hypothetical protein PO909_011882 [Leuciscus waleckii]